MASSVTGILYSIPQSIDNTTYTEYYDQNDQRQSLICFHNGVDYFVSFQNTTPSDTANMISITSSNSPMTLTGKDCPISKVFVHQSSGGAANIQIIEGR